MALQAAEFIEEARGHYRRILEATEEMLRIIDVATPKKLSELLEVRQDLIGRLKGFDARLGQLPAGTLRLQAEFHAFRADVTKKILDAEGLIIALARLKQESIKNVLATAKQAKTVSNAYDKGAGLVRSGWLNGTV